MPKAQRSPRTTVPPAPSDLLGALVVEAAVLWRSELARHRSMTQLPASAKGHGPSPLKAPESYDRAKALVGGINLKSVRKENTKKI